MFTVHSLEPRSCVEVEGDVLGSPPLMVLIVSVDVNLNSELRSCVKVEVAVLNSPCGRCGRKATLNDVHSSFTPYPGNVPGQRFLDEEVTGIAVFTHRPALRTGCRIIIIIITIIITIITPLQPPPPQKKKDT